MYSTITTKLENHIMTITFNRPESLNSFNLPTDARFSSDLPIRRSR